MIDFIRGYMMKYTVFYPTDLSEIENLYNDNIDVCVTLEDGRTFTLVFVTPDNLKWLMEKDNVNYIDFRFKFIVIEKIQKNIIETVIQELILDDELLAYYGT